MKDFELTITWPNSAPVTVKKSFPNFAHARRWKNNCLAICGKNHLGEDWKAWELITVE